MENLTKEVEKRTVVVTNLIGNDVKNAEIPEIIIRPALQIFSFQQGGLDELLDQGVAEDSYKFYTTNHLFSEQSKLSPHRVNHALLFEESIRWKLWAIALKETGLEFRFLDLAEVGNHACKTPVTISLKKPKNLCFGIRVAANDWRRGGYYYIAYRNGKIRSCHWCPDTNTDGASYFELPWIPEIKISNLSPLIAFEPKHVLLMPAMVLRPLNTASIQQCIEVMAGQPMTRVASATAAIYTESRSEWLQILQALLFRDFGSGETDLTGFKKWKLHCLTYDIRSQTLRFGLINTEAQGDQNLYACISIYRPGNFDLGINIGEGCIGHEKIPTRDYRLSVIQESKHQRAITFSDLLHGQNLALTMPQ